MTYVKGYIENVPAPAASIDVVISNGVINLATDKSKVFSEAARLLKSGGRFAISDIVTEVQLPETIVCNSTLWAACIGGAAQQDNYRGQIAAAGMKVVKVQDNPTYQFISDNARGASKKFGVKSRSAGIAHTLRCRFALLRRPLRVAMRGSSMSAAANRRWLTTCWPASIAGYPFWTFHRRHWKLPKSDLVPMQTRSIGSVATLRPLPLPGISTTCGMIGRSSTFLSIQRIELVTCDK